MSFGKRQVVRTKKPSTRILTAPNPSLEDILFEYEKLQAKLKDLNHQMDMSRRDLMKRGSFETENFRVTVEMRSADRAAPLATIAEILKLPPSKLKKMGIVKKSEFQSLSIRRKA